MLANVHVHSAVDLLDACHIMELIIMNK